LCSRQKQGSSSHSEIAVGNGRWRAKTGLKIAQNCRILRNRGRDLPPNPSFERAGPDGLDRFAGWRGADSPLNSDPFGGLNDGLLFMKSNGLTRWLALVIGLIGVGGQLFYFRHDLVDCYPYKMVSFPPHRTYVQIARVGVPLVAAAAVVLGAFLRKRRSLLAPALLPGAAPILFACVFVLMAALGNTTEPPPGYHSEFTATAALEAFLTAAVVLSLFGAIVGAVVIALLRGMASASRLVAFVASLLLALGSAFVAWLVWGEIRYL
jgi:hypothetical protein